MKVSVKKEGVLIPKRMLKGAKQVEIRKEPGRIVVLPIAAADDPVFGLGSKPGRSARAILRSAMTITCTPKTLERALP